MFSKIIVGIDGSETSEAALRMACDVAEKYDAELHLIHTPQPQTVAFAMGAVAGYHAAMTMPSPEEVEIAAQKILDKGEAIAKSCEVEVTKTYVGQGDPADAIVDQGELCGADLIVTGRRGLGSLGALVQGSTSLRISHLANCACLSVI